MLPTSKRLRGTMNRLRGWEVGMAGGGRALWGGGGGGGGGKGRDKKQEGRHVALGRGAPVPQTEHLRPEACFRAS